jgi:glycosyltransferase involved in cell wall biosynthesis
MDKLSVVLITYNEEKNIARCLDSVKEIADEIVVVDSFSNDRTKEICKAYQVRFIQNEFKGHIEQKNFAADLAQNDYVLSLDADEALDSKLKTSILKEKARFSKDAYEMNRVTCYLGKWIRHGAWYPDRKLRLWNRHKGRWGGQNPHDCYMMNDGSSIGRLKGDLLHYSYYSVEEHVKQFDKFTSISAQQMFAEGKKSSVLQIFLSPLVSFFKGFFLKMAFLDGFYGIVICIINSFATFIKYLKLRELNKSVQKKQNGKKNCTH